MRYKYHGYRINPLPYEVTATGHWAERVNLFFDIPQRTLVRSVNGTGRYPNRDEAVQGSIRLAMRVIDEGIDLRGFL